MRWVLILIFVGCALGAFNAGVAYDAWVYRSLAERSRAILPADWRSLAAQRPDALSAVEQAMTPANRQALTDANARLFTDGSGVVLALPMGLDSAELPLDTGCFRFVRSRVNLIVWQFNSDLHCL